MKFKQLANIIILILLLLLLAFLISKRVNDIRSIGYYTGPAKLLEVFIPFTV